MRLRRLVLLVSAVVLCDTVFYAVVAPLLPSFTDELGLSKASAGLLAAAYPAGTLLGSLPSGVLAGRVGPKATVVLGLALLGASSLAFGLADDVVLLDLARFVQGVGGACSWAGGLAWLVAEAPPERRGALIGTALGAGIAGALFGPVVGAVAEATSRELVFSGVLLVSAVLITAAVRTQADHAVERQTLREVGRAVRRPEVATGMWLVTLPALAFGALGVLGPLRLDDLGASGAAVGAVFLVAAGVEASLSPVVGRVSDRRGRLAPIRGGLLVAAALVLAFTLPGSALLLGATIVAITAAFGLFWAPAMAWLSDAAEAGGLSQGFAFALVNLAWAAGQVVGSGAGGSVAKATGDAVPFLAVSALCVATLAGLRGRLAAQPAA